MASGTEDTKAMEDLKLSKLQAVLDRHDNVNALAALAAAVSSPQNVKTNLRKAAIGFDTNVLLRIGQRGDKEDIVDYLDGQHDAPLIVPGQAVQEFWNNQLSAVDTAAVKLRKSFNAFKTDAKKLVGKFNDTENRIGSLLEEFTATHGHVYEEVVLRDLISVVKMLEKRSRLSFGSCAVD